MQTPKVIPVSTAISAHVRQIDPVRTSGRAA
jgi:hypothetical protein